MIIIIIRIILIVVVIVIVIITIINIVSSFVRNSVTITCSFHYELCPLYVSLLFVHVMYGAIVVDF